MGVIILAFFLSLALPAVTSCYSDRLHQISVDSQAGVNNSSCWKGGYSTPCLSLNLALTGAQHHYNHSTIIILQPGQHQLHSGSETQLRNMIQLAIVGNGSQGEVVIRCEPLAGLAFFWSQDIDLSNVTLLNCGALQNSTSTPDDDNSFLQIQVALLFLNCKAVQLTNVHVTMSKGTGAVVYNPVGVFNITSCLFSHNGVSGEQEAMYGGGGLAIEVNEVSSQSSCIISNSTFTHNTASSGQYSYWSPTTNPSEYFGLGRGGGISVVFRVEAMNNVAKLNFVTLKNNKAQYGGGLFISFLEGAGIRSNTVTIDGAEVIGNEALVDEQATSIGGSTSALITFTAYSDYRRWECPSKNSITITSSMFIADTGDGISVDVECDNGRCSYTGNKLLIDNCLFENNKAIQESSVLFSQSGVCILSLLDTTFCSCSALPGYGVPFNFPTLGCMECRWYGWAIFIFLQMVPLWIMMILLAVLHINITNGGLNGYILYSQLVSLQFPGLGLTSWVPNQLQHNVLWNFEFVPPLIVYSIWNLNFLTLIPIPFCLPLVDTAAGVILLQYVIAACPLVFIIITYTWIRWYNNGYRFVVYTTRPVHQLLARFWQKLKIQPSLIDTYAGLILLSYMRFLTVSVKFLQYIAIYAESIMTNILVVLGIAAVLCLLQAFVVLPMVVLLFYHLKIFQRCLTWCKLDRPSLHALVDAYQGCFKNSATDDIEARYFAGLYLLFRFCYLLLIVLPLSAYYIISLHDNNDDNFLLSTYTLRYFPLSMSEACLSFVMAGLVVIMRPYKKIAHNVIDFLILFFLTLIGASSFIEMIAGILTSRGPIYLPCFVFLCSFILLRLFKHCCSACMVLQRRNVYQVLPDNEGNSSPSEHKPLLKPSTASEVTQNDCANNGYADRMINPSRYIYNDSSVSQPATR